MSLRSEIVIRSALWAAYGDALGFITELADERKLRQRSAQSHVQSLMEWQRHLPGGRRPIRVAFPSGTYSDDTQLRLATGRAIRADGSFDVAAFAKVELPTWTNYALGGGISTKEAAFSLSKASTQWYSNFFETRRANYRNGGGNGAAMRIQPHVWSAAPSINRKQLLTSVIRNTICTHGHPRGIVGAAFHALCLHHYVVEQRPADLAVLQEFALQLEDCWNLILSDADLKLFWASQWQDSQDAPEELFRAVVYEVVSDIEKLQSASASSQANYPDMLRRLGLFDDSARGSGTKTAIAAAWLALRFDVDGPHKAVVTASNALGSDTDTIATMAGALLGAIWPNPPPQPVQDQAYLTSEAERLAAVAMGHATASFGYPDLRSYRPPRTAVDVVLSDDQNYVVSGLGRAEPVGEFLTTGEPNGDLRWLKLEFGQTILARIRQSPKIATDDGQRLFEPMRIHDPAKRIPVPPEVRSNEIPKGGVGPKSIDMIVDDIARGGFDPRLIGQSLINVIDDKSELPIERAISLAALVARAYRKSKRFG